MISVSNIKLKNNQTWVDNIEAHRGQMESRVHVILNTYLTLENNNNNDNKNANQEILLYY